MATQADIDAAKAAGYKAPTGSDLINGGDDAITENAVIAFLQRFYRGGLSGTDPGSNGLGFSHVSSGEGAELLGLPVKFPGHVLNLPFGSLGTRIFITSEETPRMFGQRKTSTGWQSFNDMARPFFLGGAATTAVAPMNSLDTVPTGVFSISTPLAAEQLGVPISASAVGISIRFGSLDYTFQIVFSMETPSKILTRFKFSGAFSEWSDPIGARIPQSIGGGAGSGSGMKLVPMILTGGQGDTLAPTARTYRIPMNYNAPITRWRLHVTDRNPHTGLHLGAGINISDIYFGNHAGGGHFTSAPTRIGGAIALSTLPDGEWVSGWRSEPMGDGVDRLLSYYYTSTSAPFAGVAGAWNTSGVVPGDIAPASITGEPLKTAAFDIWIEAETYAGTPVGAVFGDSLSIGAQARFPVQDSVMSQLCRDKKALPVHFAVAGNAMQDWAADTASYKWTRWESMGRADVVLWAMSSNDVYRNRTLAQMKSDFDVCYPFVISRMAPMVVMATATTRDSGTSAQHAVRVAWNADVKNRVAPMKDGRVRDVFDFDAVVNAGNDTIRAEFNADGTHLNTAGYTAERNTITRPIMAPIEIPDGMKPAVYRVDQTAGRVVTIWDYINNREQVIYNDSGARNVTAIASFITSGQAYFRIKAGWCSLSFQDVVFDYEGTILNIFPSSGSPLESVSPTTAMGQGFLVPSNGGQTYRLSAQGGGRVAAYGGVPKGTPMSGSVIWPMDRPMPSLLPGIASGSVPA